MAPERLRARVARFMTKRPPGATSDGTDRTTVIGRIGAFLAAAVLALISLGTLWFAVEVLRVLTGTSGLFRPEIALPILVVAGVIAFLLALLAVVLVLASFDLTDSRHALGLPDGSIRAVIALGLVLIFAIISIFVYADMAHPGVSAPATLTAEQLALLAPGSVISVVPGADGNFTVVTRASGTEASDDIGRQLITLVGTLVAALTAFYFGTRELTAATAAAASAVVAAGPASSVTILGPQSPVDVAETAGTTQLITVVAVPVGAALAWTISGDDTGSVHQTSPTQFLYARGTAPADEVTITFTQVSSPDARATLVVRKP